MIQQLHDPEFWFATTVGIAMLCLFVYWLITGARKKP